MTTGRPGADGADDDRSGVPPSPSGGVDDLLAAALDAVPDLPADGPAAGGAGEVAPPWFGPAADGGAEGARGTASETAGGDAEEGARGPPPDFDVEVRETAGGAADGTPPAGDGASYTGRFGAILSEATAAAGGDGGDTYHRSPSDTYRLPPERTSTLSSDGGIVGYLEAGGDGTRWGDKAQDAFDAQAQIEEKEGGAGRSPEGGARGYSDSPQGVARAYACRPWMRIAAFFLGLLVAGAMIGVLAAGVLTRPDETPVQEWEGAAEGGGSRPSPKGDGDAEEGGSRLSPGSDGIDPAIYPYVLTTSAAGWISWPRDAVGGTYAEVDGATSAGSCAARCAAMGAGMGAWDIAREACWCVRLDARELCREPCVAGRYVQFGKWDIARSDVLYCERSVCDEEWFHSDGYCVVDPVKFDTVKFDKEECDSVIQSKRAAGKVRGSGPTSFKGSLAKEVNLAKYGYPHVNKAVGAGWLTWREGLRDDYLVHYGVASAEDCAALCLAADATAGAWEEKEEACHCAAPEAEVVCREPCADADYLGFSAVPFGDYAWCEGSVCGDGAREDWLKEDSCVVEDAAACDATIEAIASASLSAASSVEVPPATTDSSYGHTYDLSSYGYPYAQRTTSVGWVSWPQDMKNNENFAWYDADAGVASVEECAEKCHESDAFTGAWDVADEACWCSFLDVADQCKEPCVEAEYVEFSTVSFAEFDYCDISVCDDSWTHSNEYCADTVKFDSDACDIKIWALADMKGVDLSEYGYPYAQHTISVGWVSPPDDEKGDFTSYDENAGVDITSVEECAAKCNREEATTGAWDVADEACWCTPLDVALLCKEPCVEVEYVGFSIVPFAEFDYCEYSVCDDTSYGDDDNFDDYYCDELAKFDSDECGAKIELLVGAEYDVEDDAVFEVDLGQLDLSMYGYPYTQHTTSAGWVSWPPDIDRSGGEFFFQAGDGVTSVEECAAKCQAVQGVKGTDMPPVGAWDVKYKGCFCSATDVQHLCKEPCVEEEYVEFATVPFSEFEYCDRSVCSKDWYHSEEYCVKQVKFDQQACDAKIDLMFGPSPPAAASTAPSGITQVDAGWVVEGRIVRIQPSAMATTKIASPDAKNEGQLYFGVENGEERVSFVRFDLSSIPEGSRIDSATLNLYLVRSLWDSDEDKIFPVSVHALPESTEDWVTGSVSYNEPLESEGEVIVGGFSIPALDPNRDKKLYTVDITYAFQAIGKPQQYVTLKVSTNKDVRLDFAGEKYNDGEAVPFLSVALLEPTIEPSANPTSKPTNKPSTSPTKLPSGAPTKSPESAITSPEETFAEGLDLSMYGYPYVQHMTSEGWVSWPQHYKDDNFASFDADDDVTSVEDCAKKCQEMKADTGAWDMADEGCWCTSKDVTGLCKEPCVELEFINFSTLPFNQFDYCQESVCADDWHHSREYCEDDIKFDKDACDAKIDALASNPSDGTASPTGSATTPKHTGIVKSEIDIGPSAMATTKYASPDAKNEGRVYFSVEDGEERESFARFDLFPVLENKVVDSAFLHLYLVRSVLDSYDVKTFKVFVHELKSNASWASGSVSYNEPLESDAELFVNSFDVVPLDPSLEKKMYKVDVTSAIDATRKIITLKLSTGSDVRLDFAGEEWGDGGDATPWLRIMYHSEG